MKPFPKILHLTCRNRNNIDNIVWINCYNKFKAMYTNYDIRLYDNNDIYKIVEKFYPQHLKVIKSIKNGGAIADTFRYLILYLYGGIYADMDCEPLRHIDELFNEFTYYHGKKQNLIEDNKYQFTIKHNHKRINNHDEYSINPCRNYIKKNDKFICKGHKIVGTGHNADIIVSNEFSKYYGENKQNGQICQWFIISKRGIGAMKACYIECIKNIASGKYLESVHDYTGPSMFTQMLNYYIRNKACKVNILPPDVFCSGISIPQTDNCFIKHHFTGTWRAEENQRLRKNKEIPTRTGAFLL